MSVTVSNYEDRQRHKADISKLKLSQLERRRWMFILEELVQNDGSDADKALALNMLNNSQGEHKSLGAMPTDPNEVDLTPGG